MVFFRRSATVNTAFAHKIQYLEMVEWPKINISSSSLKAPNAPQKQSFLDSVNSQTVTQSQSMGIVLVIRSPQRAVAVFRLLRINCANSHLIQSFSRFQSVSHSQILGYNVLGPVPILYNIPCLFFYFRRKAAFHCPV